MQHSVVETWVFVFNKSFKSSQGSWGGRGQLKAPLELLQPVGLGDWGAQFGASRAERGVEGPNLWGKDGVRVSGASTSPGTILPWGRSSAPYPGAEARGCPRHPQPYLAGPPCASAAPWWLQGGGLHVLSLVVTEPYGGCRSSCEGIDQAATLPLTIQPPCVPHPASCPLPSQPWASAGSSCPTKGPAQG